MHSLNKGESPQVTVRMPEELVERLDSHCRSEGVSRSAFLRIVLSTELNRLEEDDAA